MSSFFQQFLRGPSQPAPPTVQVDHLEEFLKAWESVKDTLTHPDERQLARGIASTNAAEMLKRMVDALVAESAQAEMGETGECLEYLLKNDVLGALVRLSETDRPRGAQAEVLRAVQNMVVKLDEQFLVHSAVHKAVLRLLRTCVGDDIQEQLDGRNRPMGAAGSSTRAPPSEHEEDLVHLLCILGSRILTYRELLMIFFHDKHWYRSEPLFAVEEEDEDEEDEEEVEVETATAPRTPSPTPSQATITGAAAPKKPEYEFLLFNYLLRFVHRDGQIGEFARAGVLFLMDVAMSPAEMTPSYDQSGGDPVNDAALALAEYILDGDFSEVLGAGLVACYSVLPRKLVFLPPIPEDKRDANATMAIGQSGLETEDVKEQLLALKDQNRAMGIDDARSPTFKAHLDHFLKMLEFLQDIIKKNVEREETDSTDASLLLGSQIVQSILDAVRRVFLENAFYSSILECSDTDGGSVAVMSYIDIMIRSLRQGPLLDLLVEFLTEEDSNASKYRRSGSHMKTLGTNPPQTQAPTDHKAAKLRRRKSSAMVLLEMEAPDSRKKSDYFTASRFTLRDLLLANLKSKNQASATAALQLLNTMLTCQPSVTAAKLLIVIPDSHATAFPHPALINSPQKLFKSSSSTNSSAGFEGEKGAFKWPATSPFISTHSIPNHLFSQPAVTYSTHEREMGLYLGLISRSDTTAAGRHTSSSSSDIDQTFSTGYEHYLFDALLAIQSQPSYFGYSDLPVLSDKADRLKHRLNANDPVLSRLLEATRSFFSNTPDFNVALTGVFATLALNPHRSLAGWLTFAHPDDSEAAGGYEDRFTGGTYDRYDDDDDDKSVDFKINEKLWTDSNVLPAARMDEHSRPVVHTVYQSLVNQLERYRLQVEDFDKYLTERRQGLLFSENLTDALHISLEASSSTTATSSSSSLSLATGAGAATLTEDNGAQQILAGTPPKSKRLPSATSALSSLWTPRKPKAKVAAATPQHSPPGKAATAAPSPFGTHYQQTGSITVEPVVAPVPFTALWTPSKKQDWNAMEEDVFSAGWSDRSMVMMSSAGSSGSGSGFGNDEEDGEGADGMLLEEEQVYKPTTVTLSQLLDNVVILEESVKELVAIIHARRSLGVDALRYV